MARPKQATQKSKSPATVLPFVATVARHHGDAAGSGMHAAQPFHQSAVYDCWTAILLACILQNVVGGSLLCLPCYLQLRIMQTTWSLWLSSGFLCVIEPEQVHQALGQSIHLHSAHIVVGITYCSCKPAKACLHASAGKVPVPCPVSARQIRMSRYGVSYFTVFCTAWQNWYASRVQNMINWLLSGLDVPGCVGGGGVACALLLCVVQASSTAFRGYHVTWHQVHVGLLADWQVVSST